ncbi:beta-ketoacyl reductase 2 [Actinidia rufa]|uniref:Beta-ketoacyl reductase 2 n=1 Tax=Actinidia rufa TaxID=165716 RepID=A0A7J0EZ73_9ERIC|nr:beta-ketoacyl reductase 2 [Actinidia rufa]
MWGLRTRLRMFFDEVEEEVWRRVVRVNLEGTTRVTRAVLPGIIERRRGAIVSIGSGAASVVPSHPLYAIYAATKAAIDMQICGSIFKMPKRGIQAIWDTCAVPGTTICFNQNGITDCINREIITLHPIGR